MSLLRSLYINNRFFGLISILVIGFIFSFVIGINPDYVKAIVLIFISFVFTDLILLYRVKKGFSAHRILTDKLSNGDNNEIIIKLENHYSFAISVRIFDEIPPQFQIRNLEFKERLKINEIKNLRYQLRPVKRGEYTFGSLQVLVSSPLSLLIRRFTFAFQKTVPVYPSFIQMRKYELMAISHRLTDTGIKKIRRIGINQEFELIKDYVAGDDYRTVNWKATARKSRLMVNQYQDERSQQVYALIDKGRLMQMPFKGMSLLDYAINASLVISNIAIKKSDKAGLITFQDRIGNILPAARLNNQMAKIQEVLYNQKTAFLESDFSVLYSTIKRVVTHRSLLLLFSNFESIHGLNRQLPYLLTMAQKHLLIVIFFENTELSNLIENKADDLKGIYHKAIAERLYLEKRLIVKELQRHGINSILTKPEDLTINTVNKYLELKARNLI